MYDFHYNFIKKCFMLNCYLLTQTVLRNHKMFMRSFLSGNISLALVTVQKIQSLFMRLIKKLLEK